MESKIYVGDCLEVLKRLPDESVQMCCTSPPYWGLRDYGEQTVTIWDAKDGCEHEWSVHSRYWDNRHASLIAKKGTADFSGKKDERGQLETDFCLNCNGWRGQLGLEPAPELYISHLVQVFEEVRRVLKKDGTLWLNLGDTYWGGNKGYGDTRAPGTALSNVHGDIYGEPNWLRAKKAGVEVNLKPKDLCEIPSDVVRALRASGWWLRSRIPWLKRNSMPESCDDRPTTAVEYVFLLTKSKYCFYDADAIRKPLAVATLPRMERGISADNKYANGAPGLSAQGLSQSRLNKKLIGRAETKMGGTGYGGDGSGLHGHSGYFDKDGTPRFNPAGRNRRNSDWFFESWQGLMTDEEGDPLAFIVNTSGFSGAHFACVDAGTECLTDEGWRPYDEIKVGMIAAQFDLVRERLSWAPIEHVAVYDVEKQLMIAAKSRDVEMLLTPNHRTVIKRRHPKSRKWQSFVVIHADALKRQHAVPVSSEWEGEWTEPISIEMAELIGWYIAEGCETTARWAIEIYQSRAANPAKVCRIRELLITLGAEFSEAVCKRTWRGLDATMVAFQVRGFMATKLREIAPNKQLPNNVLHWSERLLYALMNGLIDGDGHRRGDGRFSFIQRSRAAADTVQAIGVRLGYATMLSRRSEGTFIVYFTRKQHISFRGTGGEGARIEKRPYTGIIWCPKLPMGTWVARKNGRAFITGNTFPPKLVEPMIAAGTSEKGCCAKCGKAWIRITERTNLPLRNANDRFGKGGEKNYSRNDTGDIYQPMVNKTTGWQAACNCYGVEVREGACSKCDGRGFFSKDWSDTKKHQKEGLIGVSARIHKDRDCEKDKCETCKGTGRVIGEFPKAGETVPCTVLDLFCGSGTTGEVALRMGRRFIGIELNERYVRELIVPRLNGVEPLFRDAVTVL